MGPSDGKHPGHGRRTQPRQSPWRCTIWGTWAATGSSKNRPGKVLMMSLEEVFDDKEASRDRRAGSLAAGRDLGDDVRVGIAASTGFEPMEQEMTGKPRRFYFKPNVFFRPGKTRGWAQQLTRASVERMDENTRLVWGGRPEVSSGGAPALRRVDLMRHRSRRDRSASGCALDPRP